MVIFWKKCNRSNAVNIDNSDNPCFYVESVMKTSSGCNSSPQLSSPTVPYVCGDPNINVNLGAYDPDGDVLRYSLVAGQMPTSGNGHTNLIYEDGFNPSEPIAGMSIDPVNGNMSLATNIIGFYVVAILVEELDASNNVKGSMMVDVQFVVSSCSPFPPYMADPGVTLSSSIGADMAYDNGVAVCNGGEFCMDMVFLSDDPDDNLTLISNYSDVLPGSTMTSSGLNPMNVQICWTAHSLNEDRLLIVTVGNDDQPIPTIVSYGINIINANDDVIDLGPPILQCGLEFEVVVPYFYGGWSADPAIDISEGSLNHKLIRLPHGGVYPLVWNSGCHTDTLWVEAFEELVAEAGMDDLNCDELAYSLSASQLDSISSGQWSAHPDNPSLAIFNDINNPNSLVIMAGSGEFEFYWTVNNALCEDIDTVRIQNGMSLPEFLVNGLILILSDMEDDLDYQWYYNGAAIAGANGHTYHIDESEEGIYHVSATHSNGCTVLSDEYIYTVSGIDESNPIKWSISPNPARDFTLISWSGTVLSSGNLLISDVQGKVIESVPFNGNSTVLDVKGLDAGLYFLRLINHQGQSMTVERLLVY